MDDLEEKETKEFMNNTMDLTDKLHQLIVEDGSNKKVIINAISTLVAVYANAKVLDLEVFTETVVINQSLLDYISTDWKVAREGETLQ